MVSFAQSTHVVEPTPQVPAICFCTVLYVESHEYGQILYYSVTYVPCVSLDT